jgi:hypothetical protein
MRWLRQRGHRCGRQREVIVYDYVDGCVPLLSAMYSKRVRGYEAVGYKIQEKIDQIAVGMGNGNEKSVAV